jgi:hypothetical protein
MRTPIFRPMLICLATTLAFLVLPQANVEAQQRVERYQPARPALSPYLELFRQDSGVVDPFNAFVEPRRRLQSQSRQFQREIAGQQTTINELQRQVQGQIEIRPTGARPTGTGATFMNHSHYFPRGGPQMGGRR